MAVTKQERREKIKLKLRKTIKGTTGTPRLTVYRSNSEIYALNHRQIALLVL